MDQMALPVSWAHLVYQVQRVRLDLLVRLAPRELQVALEAQGCRGQLDPLAGVDLLDPWGRVVLQVPRVQVDRWVLPDLQVLLE